MIGIYILIGCISGAIVTWLILKPKLDTHIALDQNTIQRNEILRHTNDSLEHERLILQNERNILENEKRHQQEMIDTLQKTLKDKQLDLELEEQLMQDKLQNKYSNLIQDYNSEYLSVMSDLTKQYQQDITEKKEQSAILSKQLEDLHSIVQAAIEANKRAIATIEEKDYYRIKISDIDIQEIQKIREIEPYLRDIAPLNKVIWKSYYETPFSAMIGRVVGAQEKMGIYKITNLKNGMIYIGQANKISSRWREHVKRGLGADTPNRNKLYPAMLKDGVENFTFEILEECAENDLNDRERFWIEYYQAKTDGYNMTIGNKEKS